MQNGALMSLRNYTEAEAGERKAIPLISGIALVNAHSQ